MGRWPDDGNVDLWNYPKNCSELKVTFVFNFFIRCFTKLFSQNILCHFAAWSDNIFLILHDIIYIILYSIYYDTVYYITLYYIILYYIILYYITFSVALYCTITLYNVISYHDIFDSIGLYFLGV